MPIVIDGFSYLTKEEADAPYPPGFAGNCVTINTSNYATAEELAAYNPGDHDIATDSDAELPEPAGSEHLRLPVPPPKSWTV